jgi:arsenate reductase
MSHASIRIYHNNRCSKSRAACQLIAEKGVDAEIVDYLRRRRATKSCAICCANSACRPSELVRRGEAVFKEHYAGRSLSDDEWLDRRW